MTYPTTPRRCRLGLLAAVVLAVLIAGLGPAVKAEAGPTFIRPQPASEGAEATVTPNIIKSSHPGIANVRVRLTDTKYDGHCAVLRLQYRDAADRVIARDPIKRACGVRRSQEWVSPTRSGYPYLPRVYAVIWVEGAYEHRSVQRVL